MSRAPLEFDSMETSKQRHDDGIEEMICILHYPPKVLTALGSFSARSSHCETQEPIGQYIRWPQACKSHGYGKKIFIKIDSCFGGSSVLVGFDG